MSFDASVRAALEAVAVPADAAPMAAYMKGRFPFLGVKTPARRAATNALVREFDPGDGHPRRDAVLALWDQAPRELQYVGCDLLSRHWRVATVPLCHSLITTKSWWDTVDAVSPTVGRLVLRDPALALVVDGWLTQDDRWLIRVAIIHQLGWTSRTDATRLFAACALHAAHPDFFVRKGIGWALRDYAKTDPAAVVSFVRAHPELSGLSRREALKHVTVGP